VATAIFMLLQRHNSRICRKKHKNISYDANGALLTDGLRHYAYDSEGRLAAASLGWATTTGTSATTDDSITKYAHNSQAQRVFKTAPQYTVTNPAETANPFIWSTFTTYLESLWSPTTAAAQKSGMSYFYDEDGTLIADTLTGGATTTWGQSARYIYLPTASGPMPVAAIYGTKHYAIQSDHLNTPRRLIQSDGQVAWQWTYSAFGDEKPTIAKNRFANTDLNQSFGTTTVPAVTFNLRYPGQYFDLESNLHYNYHRSYHPGGGRYTQSDPIGLDGGWNRFGYAEMNPLEFTDPEGLSPFGDFGGGTLGDLPACGIKDTCQAICKNIKKNAVHIAICAACWALDKRPPPPPPKPPVPTRPAPAPPGPKPKP
jgi:RHS repeat-associated protein